MPSAAKTTYDRMASLYDRRWAGYTRETLRSTAEGLALRGDERVLDLAAGTGELARRLLARWPDLSLVGLDLSHPMLLRGCAKPDLRRWEPVQGDAIRLPFEGSAFDAILCANAFHHFPAPGRALAEMRRVLRPGGMLTLTDWCDDYLTGKLRSLYLRVADPSFHRAYTLRQCRRAMESAGFTVVAARKFKIDWSWGLMRIEARPTP